MSHQVRRTIKDELSLYKVMSGAIETGLRDKLLIFTRERFTRKNVFYLLTVTKKFEPMPD